MALTQEEAVYIATRQLLQLNLISIESLDEVKECLNPIYSAGYTQRSKEYVGHNLRPVTVCNKEGKPMQHFISVKDARTKMHISTNTIQPALKTGEPTKKGHIYKYTDEIS